MRSLAFVRAVSKYWKHHVTEINEKSRRDFQTSIERDTDPTRLSPDNVTMVIAVLCGDNQVE